MSFQPRTRLQKILMGIAATPRTALEHAVKYAVDHAGGGGGPVYVPFTLNVGESGEMSITTTANFNDVVADVIAGKMVFARVDQGEMIIDLPLTAKNSATNPTGLLFSYACDFTDEGMSPDIYILRFSALGANITIVKLAIANG